MNPEKEMQAVILAGGLGTRLRPITETIPKPMVSICGKPFLEYQINQIRKCGIKKIILCTGYLGNIIEEYFEDGNNFGVDLEYSHETEQLGTAGAIKNAESLIGSNPFIVMNGDTYSNVNLRDLFFVHNQHNNSMTMVVTKPSNPKEQDLVELKEDMVINFHKRDTLEHKEHLEKNLNPLINAGIYVFNKEILDIIPKGKISFEKDIFPQLLGRINKFEYFGYFIDLANKILCEKFEKDISEGLYGN